MYNTINYLNGHVFRYVTTFWEILFCENLIACFVYLYFFTLLMLEKNMVAINNSTKRVILQK